MGLFSNPTIPAGISEIGAFEPGFAVGWKLPQHPSVGPLDS